MHVCMYITIMVILINYVAGESYALLLLADKVFTLLLHPYNASAYGLNFYYHSKY